MFNACCALLHHSSYGWATAFCNTLARHPKYFGKLAFCCSLARQARDCWTAAYCWSTPLWYLVMKYQRKFRACSSLSCLELYPCCVKNYLVLWLWLLWPTILSPLILFVGLPSRLHHSMFNHVVDVMYRASSTMICFVERSQVLVGRWCFSAQQLLLFCELAMYYLHHLIRSRLYWASIWWCRMVHPYESKSGYSWVSPPIVQCSSYWLAGEYQWAFTG